jgi:hypothetical protein
MTNPNPPAVVVEPRWAFVDCFTIQNLDTGKYEYFGPYDPAYVAAVIATQKRAALTGEAR